MWGRRLNGHKDRVCRAGEHAQLSMGRCKCMERREGQWESVGEMIEDTEGRQGEWLRSQECER